MRDCDTQPVSAVIFDLDGTLVDASASIIGCFNEFMNYHKFDFDPKSAESIIGPPLKESLALYFHLPAELENAVKQFQSLYVENWIDKIRPIPGVRELLSFLNEKLISCYIVSSNQDAVVQRVVRSMKFGDSIESATGVRARDEEKNKTLLVAKLLETRALCKNRVVLIGDTESDHIAAKSNDIRFWAVLYGQLSFEKAERLGPRPHGIFESAFELQKKFAALADLPS